MPIVEMANSEVAAREILEARDIATTGSRCGRAVLCVPK